MTKKVLGQSDPLAATLTNIYTVPASTETTVSTITACNYGASATTIRIAVRPNGAAISDEHYIYYDLDLPAKETFASTIGITMDASDVLSVYATLATVSFNVFGNEATV